MQQIINGETDHCRSRLLKYCNGQGLDLGCGHVKIHSNAIGIDLYNPKADMSSDARDLSRYSNNYFDFIYSSHLLEEIDNTEATLKEWLRILKPGGYLVLYQADKNVYYPIGHAACNSNHKHHFVWEELWAILKNLGNTELTHSQRPINNEWSFELVVKKTSTDQLQ